MNIVGSVQCSKCTYFLIIAFASFSFRHSPKMITIAYCRGHYRMHVCIEQYVCFVFRCIQVHEEQKKSSSQQNWYRSQLLMMIFRFFPSTYLSDCCSEFRFFVHPKYSYEFENVHWCRMFGKSTIINIQKQNITYKCYVFLVNIKHQAEDWTKGKKHILQHRTKAKK